MTLLRAITTVGGFTLISRVTGFARDILVAGFLGAGMVADAFFVAFKFPNLFRRLFAEGAFNAAFVPLYAQALEQGGDDKAQAFARQSLSALAALLLVFVLVMQVLMPWAMLLFAPGFLEVPGKFDLTVLFTRITFPYLLLIALVSLLSGVLNAQGRFWVAAATPILLNLSLIAALLALSPLLPTPGHALAWGTSLAGLLQLAWVWIACRKAGLDIRLIRPRWTSEVARLLKRVVPGALGAGIYQVNLLVDTILASFLVQGSVSYLYYADRINQLPLGVVGTAIGTALLPTLSRQLGAGNTDAALHSQNRSLEFALVITLPAMLGLVALSVPIVGVLFERGAFGPQATRATADALAAFALGLPAFVLVKVLTPAFFARHDTATPVKVAVTAMIANVAMSLVLMIPLKHVGIALSSALAAWLNVGLLAYLVHTRGYFVLDERLKRRLPRLALAALTMGVACHLAAGWIAGGLVMKALLLAAVIVGGAVLYAGLALVLGGATLDDIRRRGRNGSEAKP
ncbi:MAG: murein biosynthesis integral membrane protein MurJ [Rhodospirillales bacterium]|nr:murein biosynthesis integral membrane protein MurJ [Rhodospirillales bacterium]